MSEAHQIPELEQLHDYPYSRLARLLSSEPADLPQILTHIGEPQGNPPAFVAEEISRNQHLWSKYPPLKGTPDYRRAVADFLTRRYQLAQDYLDPDRHILPVAGTREALFQTALLAAARKRARLDAGIRPVICLPNPMYHVYFGGALLAHADIRMVDATTDNNFVPDYESLDPELLDRTALIYLCSPGQPDRNRGQPGSAENHD